MNLRVGGDLTIARSGSEPAVFRGYGLFIDLDSPRRLGAELALHQIDAPRSIVYERTYEAGIRYHWQWRSLEPYAKALYGRGVFNFPPYAPPADAQQARANLAYNLAAVGGGLELPAGRLISLRAEATWQHWFPGDYPTTPLPGSPDCPFLCHGLQPVRFSLGAAFRIPAGRVRRR